ncbi:hypothetical protein, partial [Rhizobium tibeticum]|uniref:hypothetical protein n=1 Tax=Rhizobium tibeticum TaxID=501024 RepID=UPI001FCD2387
QQVGPNDRFADLKPFRYRTNGKALFVRQSQYRSICPSHFVSLACFRLAIHRTPLNQGPEWQTGACESRSLYRRKPVRDLPESPSGN